MESVSPQRAVEETICWRTLVQVIGLSMGANENSEFIEGRGGENLLDDGARRTIWAMRVEYVGGTSAGVIVDHLPDFRGCCGGR